MIGEKELAGRRVAIVLHCFDRGGSGRVAGHLARGFLDAGLSVELLVFARGGPAEGAVLDLIGADIPTTFILDRVGFRPADLVRGFAGMVRVLRRARPDVVVAAANNVAFAAAAAVAIALDAKAKLFLKTTNPIVGSRHSGLLKTLRLAGYRAAFRRADGVWTLSREETIAMEEAFGPRDGLFRDVVNPYVTAAMLKPPASSGVKTGGKAVISVARLTRQKRIERLLRGVAACGSDDVRLLILGDGEERASLVRLADQLGLTGRVAMPGHVADVASALHSADLFLLTSDYEGLPAVVLEAMAANCPVLSTDSFPAARALLGNAEGCAVIEDHSPVALGAQIDDHLTRSRPTALHLVAERYSIANGVRSHLAAMVAGEFRSRQKDRRTALFLANPHGAPLAAGDADQAMPRPLPDPERSPGHENGLQAT